MCSLTLGQIDPKRAIPRAEHERTAKVFVGGLAPSVSSESLKAFLTQFGGVMDATVMFDRETSRSKGFAFATFADEDAVGRAMAASGIELEGKQVSGVSSFPFFISHRISQCLFVTRLCVD